MSQENEALVRQAYEAYSRGDTPRLLELIDPGVEWTYLDPADADPQPQVCHGRGQFCLGAEPAGRTGPEIGGGGGSPPAVTRSWSSPAHPA